MHTLRSHRPMEDDGLQTDVMRFMAIIAFCLVAVLALVKDVAVEQPAASPTPPEPRPEPVSTVEVAPVESAPQELEPPPELEPVPVREPMPAPASMPAPDPIPEPAIETPPPAEPIQHSQPGPGLTLRFASDADFVDLVRRGEVRVYAFAGDAYRVLDRAFVFRPAQPPATYHELESVPRRVEAALGDTLPGNGWAVRLPSRTSTDIRRLAEEFDAGQLVIDRTGGVRHVASR